MSKQIKLKNVSGKSAILDDKGYKAVTSDKYLGTLKFTENLRAHSAGYPIYQRCITTKKGLVYETIYLHRWLADKFIKKPKSNRKLFLRFKNGNVLDCRLENLEYMTMSDLRKATATKKKKVVKKAPAKKVAAKAAPKKVAAKAPAKKAAPKAKPAKGKKRK